MALNPDRPTGRRQQAPPPEAPLAVPAARAEIEIDRVVDAVHREARERAPHAVDAREREGRARSVMERIPENVHDFAPRWSRPLVRGLLKRLAGVGEAMNLDFASFPFIGRQVSDFARRHDIEPGQAVGRQEARSFYDMLVHHEIFKAFKQEARQGRILTPADRERIQNKIITEQPHDPQEVVRQERTLEDFNRAMRRGQYGTAARTYEHVTDYRNGYAIWEDYGKELNVRKAIEANKSKKREKQKTEEQIRSEFFPDGITENLRRNELLQKYLRVAASRHIADMIEGRGDNPHAHFLVMFENFWPIERLQRDDIPLDDPAIEGFFSQMGDDIRENIARITREREQIPSGPEAAIQRQTLGHSLRRRVQAAINLGILTQEDSAMLDAEPDADVTRRMPNRDLGTHLVEEGDEIATAQRDRIERTLITDHSIAQRSPEVFNRERQRLDAAWREDVAADSDVYSRFDKARALALERIAALPRVTRTEQRTERDKASGKNVARSVTIEVPVMPAVRDSYNQELVGIDNLEDLNAWQTGELQPRERLLERLRENPATPPENIAHVEAEVGNIREQYADARRQLLGHTSIMDWAEIEVLMNEEFRNVARGRLVDAFDTSYERFARQRAAVSRVRDETYAPYRILSNSDIDEAREIIRQGPAREKLVAATLRGEPTLQMEEDMLQNLGIFTREELEDRRNAVNQLIRARRIGLPENVIANSEEQFIQMGMLSQEELDQLRPEIERRARE